MTDETPKPLWDGWLDLTGNIAPPVLTRAAGGLPTSYITVSAGEAAVPTVEERLLAHCRAFISKQGITCPETVYQCDWVIENAYEFIEGICDIVGYQSGEDDAA